MNSHSCESRKSAFEMLFPITSSVPTSNNTYVAPRTDDSIPINRVAILTEHWDSAGTLEYFLS